MMCCCTTAREAGNKSKQLVACMNDFPRGLSLFIIILLRCHECTQRMGSKEKIIIVDNSYSLQRNATFLYSQQIYIRRTKENFSDYLLLPFAHRSFIFLFSSIMDLWRSVQTIILSASMDWEIEHGIWKIFFFSFLALPLSNCSSRQNKTNISFQEDWKFDTMPQAINFFGEKKHNAHHISHEHNYQSLWFNYNPIVYVIYTISIRNQNYT